MKKYADNDQLPEEKVPIKKGMMYEEKWGEIVIDWLMEDFALKKKLRSKNTTIYEQLQDWVSSFLSNHLYFYQRMER